MVRVEHRIRKVPTLAPTESYAADLTSLEIKVDVVGYMLRSYWDSLHSDLATEVVPVFGVRLLTL